MMKPLGAVPFTCIECPAFGTEMCGVLSDLGMLCDVKLAASEAFARTQAMRVARRRRLHRMQRAPRLESSLAHPAAA